MAEINYQELLIKYVAHVIDTEGTAFIGPMWAKSKYITDTEWAILEIVADDRVKFYTDK